MSCFQADLRDYFITQKKFWRCSWSYSP